MNYDTNKIYDISEYPDVKSGRCDNCDSSHFKSKIGDGKFLRECRKCGMKKLI
ncbi:hypothetical protein [Cytobacillus purgationiresistens]|uniref:hypothetical protein n=1 Tax=Cytobacillus purgationiresistens TaxID=863449 RepID=UPI0027D88305|nr:hypothetical protein [Cytobacillus purgationiresistens]